MISDEQADDLLDKGTPPSPALEVAISDELPDSIREAVQIMAAELRVIHEAIQQLAIAEIDAALLLVPGLTTQMQRYSDALSSLGFTALAEVVDTARANLSTLADLAMAEDQPEALGNTLALLGRWPQTLLACLSNPANEAATNRLLSFMQDSAWPMPLSAEQARVLKNTLLKSGFTVPEKIMAERQRSARAADVSLQLQDDVSQDLLDGLLAELPGQTEEFSAAISRLTDGGTLEDVQIAKRVAHTLKGAANTVGVRGIATLTHHLEDLLLILSKHKRLPSVRISETLMNAADCLAAMSETLLGTGRPPQDARETLQEVLDLVNLIEQEGIQVADLMPARAEEPALSDAEGRQSGEPGAVETGKPGINMRESGSFMMRVPAGFVDNLLRLVGETIIMTGQVRDRVHVTRTQIKNMQGQFALIRQLGSQLEEIVDVKDLTGLQRAGTLDSDYDSLEMDLYSELHTCCRRLVEAAVDANEEAKTVSENLLRLDEMLLEQARLNNETQEGVMRARMVPVSSQFARLQRSVRQASRITGKAVRLHLHGGDTLIDTNTLNNLLDPLMHLLRNAIDHGIEERAVRLAAGKPATGDIYLTFMREGNQILVRCQDDGKGLDYAAIKRKAMEQGIYQPQDEISDDELKQLILRSDFSTSAKITQISGRGIGMDAVYAAIVQMSGSFIVESDTGKGCTVEIKLPQTLVSSYVLLIRAGPQLVAIANRGIVQIIHHQSGRLLDYGGKQVFQLGEHSYPAHQFENMINMVFERRSEDRESRSVLLVENEQGRHAVMVEKIIGGQDLVVKDLGHYVPRLTGVSGVTILGDGSVTPVVDLPELVRVTTTAGKAASRYQRTEAPRSNLPSALIVDDSLSARRSLAQFMQDAGYTVRMARDGVEAFKIIKVSKPDIVLSDLEMPRMTGLELIGHIRADGSISDIPCIMITSRAAARHQQEAMTAGVDAYLIKPYSEDELMEKIQSICSP